MSVGDKHTKSWRQQADEIAAAIIRGDATICLARCEPCQWGQHYDEPTWHSWAGPEDIDHATCCRRQWWRTATGRERRSASGCHPRSSWHSHRTEEPGRFALRLQLCAGRAMSRPLLARYPGECAGCGDWFDVDEEVAYVDDELMHADCAEDGPPPPLPSAPPCPSCWTVHAGECM